jgi:hypothetical protein
VDLTRDQGKRLGSGFKPEEYCRYFEELNLLPKVALAKAQNRAIGAVSGLTLVNKRPGRSVLTPLLTGLIKRAFERAGWTMQA